MTYFQNCFEEQQAVSQQCMQTLEPVFNKLMQYAVQSIQSGGKIIFFGNGGSAADAQHLATELTVRFSSNRPAIAALALTTDTSTLTAIANDFDFSELFKRQLEALCQPQDLVIGITTSGNSDNVIKALNYAHVMGAKTAAFTGESGGKLTDTHLLLKVPSKTTARIQEMHITIGQIFCGELEQKLGLV